MQQLKALCITERNIIALYEKPNGERVAHDLSRLESPPQRRGTWQQQGSIYTVTFGVETTEIEAVSVASIFMRTSRATRQEPETWADRFRRETIGVTANGN